MVAGGLRDEEAAKTLARKSMAFTYLAGADRDRDFKHRFGHVNGDRRTIHPGSSFHRSVWTQGDFGTLMPFKSREESIPSLERTGKARRSAPIR